MTSDLFRDWGVDDLDRANRRVQAAQPHQHLLAIAAAALVAAGDEFAQEVQRIRATSYRPTKVAGAIAFTNVALNVIEDPDRCIALIATLLRDTPLGEYLRTQAQQDDPRATPTEVDVRVAAELADVITTCVKYLAKPRP